MKSRFRQFLLIILIGLVGVFVGFIIYAYVILQLSLPVTDGTLNFTELDKPVEITYDRMGIPQIWAKTEHDGYFALGYLHASDRMFQMELLRRISQGRLSEILGDILHDIDISQRQMGHYRLAQKALDSLSDENRNRLQAMNSF